MKNKIENTLAQNVPSQKNIDDNYLMLVEKKIDFFKDVIQKTIIHVNKNKTVDILGISDVSICVERLTNVNLKINKITEEYSTTNPEIIINNLQIINNELSSIFSCYGTHSFDDLLNVCFGNNYHFLKQNEDLLKFDLLKKCFHPTSYKLISKKNEKTQNEFKLYEKSKNLDCFESLTAFKHFHMKVYGIKIFINNTSLNKSLVISGILDDVILEFLNSNFITEKQKSIYAHLPSDFSNSESFKNFMFFIINYFKCD
jgi:hypothetical protein